jgi:parallel beta-helix repeat protein
MNLRKLLPALCCCFLVFFGSYHLSAADTYTVINTNDSGSGSLRDAINLANLHSGPDTILFDTTAFPEGTRTTITISSSPDLSLIDPGTTIEGDGRVILTTDIPILSRPPGIQVKSNDNIIRGLQIVGFWVGIDLVRGTTCQNNTIEGNVISNNRQIGISLGGQSCSENRIVGNYIGLDPSGTVAYDFQATGIDIHHGAHHNTVGGSTPEERNVISGNRTDGPGWGVGVLLSDTTYEGPTDHGNVVIGNYIGTDYTGSTSIPNDWGGIDINKSSPGNIIKGNVISGNSGTQAVGIRLNCSTVIKGNIIGLTADGQNPLPNGVGILGGGDNIVIGGLGPNEGNIISGNTDRAIWLGDGDGGVIEGNYIGTDPAGNNFANRIGIRLASDDASASNWRIGPNNYIWFNSDLGIRIDQGPDFPAVHNTITQNSITVNGDGSSGKGIDLSGFPDIANAGIVPPVINSVTANQVAGTASAPDGSIVEIFQDVVGQGEVYLGSTVVTSGQFLYNGFIVSCSMGGYITATVTDPDGNTSEFSSPVENSLSLPSGVSAMIFGIIPKIVECTNESTGQHVEIEDVTTAIDCEAAGLVVNPEDKILIEIKNYTKKNKKK